MTKPLLNNFFHIITRAVPPAALAALLAATVFIAFNYLSLGVDEDTIAASLGREFTTNAAAFRNDRA
jgi:hypothetical protein